MAETLRRIDYYDDPEAPPANSLVPSANVVVVNEAGELLLIHRSDNDNWALPGGAMDLGESLVDTAVRETLEETGITSEVTGLVGIYTDPKHVILYTSDGEARQEFSVVFTARSAARPPRAASPAAWNGSPPMRSRACRWTARCASASGITCPAGVRPIWAEPEVLPPARGQTARKTR